MTHTIYTQPEVNLHAVKALAGLHSPQMPAADGVLTSEDVREQADARLTRGGYESIDDTARFVAVCRARARARTCEALAEREAP